MPARSAASGSPSWSRTSRATSCLADYLAQHTAKPIAIALGLPTLAKILDDRYYQDLEGGVLESFGRLFKSNVKLFVYPQRDEHSGRTITLDDLEVPGPLRHLLTT